MEKKLFTLVEAFIVFVILVMFSFTLFGGIFLIKGCDHVRKNGLKPTLEKIWDGPTATEIQAKTETKKVSD